MKNIKLPGVVPSNDEGQMAVQESGFTSQSGSNTQTGSRGIPSGDDGK